MRSVPDVAFVISNLIARQHASEPILKTVFENSVEANDCGMAAVRSSFPGRCNPFRVADPKPIQTQGSAGAQPWAE